jgi:uncharacterized protein (TIGR02996 family)
MDDERPFLRQIIADPHDLNPRLVYADWLEERGECEQAEFLRLECDLIRLPPTEPHYLQLNDRYHQLHAGLDPKWLALLDRTDIDNCRLKFGFRCPLRWERLRVTDDDRVRFCNSCKQEVHHCHSIDEARTEAQAGRCVAVDSRLAREPGDLEPETTEELVMGMLALPPIQDSPAERLLRRYLEFPRPHWIDVPLTLPRRKRWWQFWR